VDSDGAQGEHFLHEVSGGDVPETLEMRSGGNGRGLLYAIPAGITLRPTHQHGDKVHEGLSLLGQGSQTVMPPSRHKSGRRYAWVPGHGPDDIKPALAPSWLVELMSKSRSSRSRKASASGAAPQSGGKIPEGSRDSTLTSLAGSMRRRGMSRDAILAALRVENKRCEPPLDDAQVEKIADSIAGYEPAERRPAADIIRDFLRTEYEPTHRSGTMIRSHTRGLLLKRSDVIAGAPGPLIEQLTEAIEASRDESGHALRKCLPKVYRDWVPTAYANLLSELPDEEDAVEVEGSAALEFRRKVATALYGQVTLGEDRDGNEIQIRKSLIDWCCSFAKPGPLAIHPLLSGLGPQGGRCHGPDRCSRRAVRPGGGSA
jgi:hypothetical protein